MVRRNKRISSTFAAILAASSILAISNAAMAAGKSEFDPAQSFSGAFLAGSAALQDFDFDAAAAYFGEALTYDPENADLKRETMIALINGGRFDEAIPFAEELKDTLEVERISRLVLAVEAIKNGEYDKAQPLLILSQPNDIERLLTGIMGAWATLGQGNSDAALKAIDALEGPEWFSIFKSYHSALIANAAGMKDDAGKRFSDGMNDPNGSAASPLTYLRLAQDYAEFLVQNGKIEEAKKIVERGLALAPNNPELLSLSENIGAQTDFVIIEAPKDGAAEILLNIGSAINREGAETFASLYLEMSRAAKPDVAQTLFELGAIADRMGLTERAIALYQEVPTQSPMSHVAELQLGLSLSALERNEEALTTLRQLVDKNPEDYQGYMALGGVLATEKKWDESIAVYNTALTKLDNEDPRFWALHYRLGIAYERAKQWDKAEAAFKHALKLAPNQPDVLNYLGYSWVDMNIHLDEGIKMIQKAVETRPNDGFIIDSLGWAHYRLGKFDDAVDELERATELMTRDSTINDHLGDAYWRVGRKIEAVYQWQQVLEMEVGETDMDNVRAKIKAAETPNMEPNIGKSVIDAEGAAAPEVALEPAKPEKTIAKKPNDAAELENGGAGTYTVQKGDTLLKIARDILGDVTQLNALIDLNKDKIPNPNSLIEGITIKLPEK